MKKFLKIMLCIMGSLLTVIVAFGWEYPKVCVNLQTDVR